MGSAPKVKKDRNILSAERDVSMAYRQDISDFQRNVMPLAQSLVDSLSDNSMVSNAIDANKQTSAMSADMQKRNTARYGLGMSSNQQTALARQRKRDLAANMAGNENNSRLMQQDRNENVALGLTTMGNSYSEQGTGDMMRAIGLGSNRANQNAQSAAQAKQQNLGTAMSLATMAIMV